MPSQPSKPFTPQEALEFMQRMWNPFGMPVPGFTPPGTAAASVPFPNPAAMFATLDPAVIICPFNPPFFGVKPIRKDDPGSVMRWTCSPAANAGVASSSPTPCYPQSGG